MTPQTRADVRIILILVLIVLVFMLLTGRHARADNNIITCEHVKQASLITGQSEPRDIARALGLKLTSAQLAEAAKCLRRER